MHHFFKNTLKPNTSEQNITKIELIYLGSCLLGVFQVYLPNESLLNPRIGHFQGNIFFGFSFKLSSLFTKVEVGKIHNNLFKVSIWLKQESKIFYSKYKNV